MRKRRPNVFLAHDSNAYFNKQYEPIQSNQYLVEKFPNQLQIILNKIAKYINNKYTPKNSLSEEQIDAIKTKLNIQVGKSSQKAQQRKKQE